jgi:hypothetical protein
VTLSILSASDRTALRHAIGVLRRQFTTAKYEADRHGKHSSGRSHIVEGFIEDADRHQSAIEVLERILTEAT